MHMPPVLRLAVLRTRRALRSRHLILALLAIGAGTVGGLTGIAFREAIGLVQFIGYGLDGEILVDAMQALPWWHIVLVTTTGGLLVGLMVRFLMPGERPAGVPDVIEATALRGGRVSLRQGIGAAAVSAITLGSGGSAGREGPVVHLAAACTSFLAARLRLGRSLTVTLLGCGVAAGVASSFNAPIAGVFFALEVVTGNYALAAFTPIVIASVVGTLVSRAYYGDFPAFIIPPHEIASFWEFPAFAILGVLSALAAVLFLHSVKLVRRVQDRIGAPRWLRPAMGGLLVGTIGIFFPHILGVGYEATDMALKDVLGLEMLVILLVLKTAATAVTIGSGSGGGVFSPSLFIGAMLGGAFGIVATSFLPALSSGHSAYTMVGMGAVAGAVLGAPISTILIVFELTGGYELTIAVMIATVISSQLMRALTGHSFFTWQLAQRGIELTGGREERVLRARRIWELVKLDLIKIAPEASMEDVRHALQDSRYGEVFVVDPKDRLIGTITLKDLAERAFDTSQDDGQNAGSIARSNPPVAYCEDDLEAAMWLMEGCGEEHIAVVDDKETRHLVGVLHERDLMAAYHRAVLETRRDHGL